jgi:hypothetical protein
MAMFRDDYLMRVIKAFAAGLAAARRAIGNTSYGAAHLSLESLSLEYLGLNLETLATQSLVIVSVGRPPYEIAMAADLLAEYAVLEAAKGSDPLTLQVRALHVYKHALDQDSTLLRHDDRRVRLTALVFATSETKVLAIHQVRFALLEQLGLFGQAEDLLFTLAESGWIDALVYGRAFFQRLSVLDDEYLSEGGLPRAECIQGLGDLMVLCGPPADFDHSEN